MPPCHGKCGCVVMWAPSHLGKSTVMWAPVSATQLSLCHPDGLQVIVSARGTLKGSVRTYLPLAIIITLSLESHPHKVSHYLILHGFPILFISPLLIQRI